MPVALPEHETGTAWAQREGTLMARCRAKNAEGKPCRAPEGMVDPITRYCPAHRPGATERLREAGKTGAEVSTRLKQKATGLSSDELPPLDSPQAAATWLEAIGRAVACGRLAIIEKAGHAAHLENPDAFGDLVECFLREVEADLPRHATREDNPT